MTADEEQALTRLMALSQEGDPNAYEALLRQLREVVHAYVHRRTGEVAWEEDAVQEILFALHRARHTWNPARPFVPWLYAVVQSRLIDVFRRERRSTQRDRRGWSRMAVPVTASPEGALLAAHDLRAALAHLPSPQRQVVELLKVEGRSVRDVSRSTGLSEANVRVIAHRGMKVLRSFIARGTPHDD
ncbi:MAG: sigma-70 family RNA polymerase sigma factor [Dehalococcoidia bacterium]